MTRDLKQFHADAVAQAQVDSDRANLRARPRRRCRRSRR